MKISIATILSIALIFPGSALAALTPNEVVININVVTSVSRDITTALVSPLFVLSTPSLDIPTAKSVVTGFKTIIQDLGTDITAMQATPAFGDSITQPIVDALITVGRFSPTVHQALLSTIIGKHSILAQFALTAPIAAILRSLEAVIDSFAFALIALIPTRSGSVNTSKATLGAAVSETITLYGQLCIPSPLYPVIQPICIGL
ncbi:hypothetical protein DFH06DRAFT_1427924 [Mycena polygramma]|nr:hypothetical protein DFH06DRAFT_1427924 [Mycena polygramma]